MRIRSFQLAIELLRRSFISPDERREEDPPQHVVREGAGARQPASHISSGQPQNLKSYNGGGRPAYGPRGDLGGTWRCRRTFPERQVDYSLQHPAMARLALANFSSDNIDASAAGAGDLSGLPSGPSGNQQALGIVLLETESFSPSHSGLCTTILEYL
ncbi:hypothetical protein HPB50_029405 [Hyalomma asiaticum]|nr:hypothetical protein HPB50_029405 [Hyalomma asiaticum]